MMQSQRWSISGKLLKRNKPVEASAVVDYFCSNPHFALSEKTQFSSFELILCD
jgi:hypothetical protein